MTRKCRDFIFKVFGVGAYIFHEFADESASIIVCLFLIRAIPLDRYRYSIDNTQKCKLSDIGSSAQFSVRAFAKCPKFHHDLPMGIEA